MGEVNSEEEGLKLQLGRGENLVKRKLSRKGCAQ